MKHSSIFFSLLATALLWKASATEAETSTHTFALGTNDFLLDGQRLQIRCGEVHAARVPREYWRQRLKMCKAMGLNTVCAYLFWNLHEPRPGEFNWSDQADDVEFCKIAQEEGLWVILRPGPYSCAEWEMGGTPWWLLKNADIKLRSRDPRYLAAARNYLLEVGRKMGPMQITHGGAILMVQVENEYAFYGNDSEYMGAIRQDLIDAGFNVPLFACNSPSIATNGFRADLFQAGNFGSDPAGNFKKLRELQPVGPLICSEFYPGWFDTWGQPHHYGNTDRYLTDLKTMLDMDASFSIYMAHGGTTFGLWSGCDSPFKPDTSSYDYDAPISEAGWTTAKFFKTRALLTQYILPGETVPEPPAKNPTMTLAPVTLAETAPLLQNLPKAISDDQPQNMEAYDQGYGCILYGTTIPAGPAATLEAATVHDFGFVFVDGKRAGIFDRRSGNFRLSLPERSQAARLDILVEPMGRVNFGEGMVDRKGLIAPVKLNTAVLSDWKIYRLPLDRKMLGKLKWKHQPATGPAFWRGTFTLEEPGDTFLDLHNWGKGDLWVNGHCLGRYWNIGPTQTAYLPGCWLHAGQNEIVILDLLGPTQPVVAGLDQPVLDELRPELDFAKAHRPNVRLHLDGVVPAIKGSFASGADPQTVKLDAPVSGRFFCLKSLNAHDGKPYAAVAELDLLDTAGNIIPHDGWTIAYVDSEERNGEDGSAENAIDGQTANFWHTEWKNNSPDHPHYLILNLGQTREISGFRYVPRQSPGAGRIKDYEVIIGDDLVESVKK